MSSSETTEEWRPIPDYEGLYEVSDKGRVRSFHKGPPVILSQNLATSGYLIVHLYCEGVRSPRTVHRLVARAFLGEPAVDQEVNHVDYNRLKNDVKNLVWCTHLDNVRHSAPRAAVQGIGVVATPVDTAECGFFFPSQIGAERFLFGRQTGIVSWALRHSKPAKGYFWGRTV